MNRYFVHIVSVTAFLAGVAFAQDVPENAILDLEGGKFRVDGAFYSPVISGGPGIGYKSSEAWDLWANPAAPVTFHEPYISLAYGPAILSDPQRFYDVNATIRQEVDAAIEEFRSAESRIDYPKFASQIGQQSELAGLFEEARHLLRPDGDDTRPSVEGQRFREGGPDVAAAIASASRIRAS